MLKTEAEVESNQKWERVNGDSSASSFRDGPQDQAQNLEIPGSMLRIAPE
jgi:hypothetical protein